MLSMSESRSRKKYERDYYAKGDVVRRLRNRAHMTLDDLEKASGVNYTTINRIERGHNKSPQWKTLKPLAKALGVPVDDLVVYTDDLSEVPDEPGLTEKNEVGLEAARRRKAELDAEILREGDGRDTGGRAP